MTNYVENPLLVRQTSEPPGWWGVYRVRRDGLESLHAGPFRKREHAERELAQERRA